MTTRLVYYGAACGAMLLALSAPLPSASASQSGIAQGYPEHVESMDSREVAMLPAYCRYTQIFRDKVPGGNNLAEIRRWSDTIGPVFNAMHHYCFGLMKTHRALFIAKTPQYRKFYFESSVDEFDYVLRNATPGFALLPEILTRKAENLFRLRRTPEALSEVDRATTVKPDYWPPYAVASDYYRRAGEPDKARAWLQRGLAASPASRALKTRLAELGPKPRPAAGTSGAR